MELEEEDVQEIYQKTKEPISNETLFEEFVEQIEWNKEEVAMQNPYYPAQIVSMAYKNIDKFGLYQDDFRKCSRKTQSDKTWGNFKAHFAWAFKETQRPSRILKTKGYVAHVHAAQANEELFTNTKQDRTLALANLATATQADRISVALLTKTISELSGQVALTTAKLSTAQDKNARMKKWGQQSTTAGHGHRASRNLTLLDPNQSQYQNLYSRSGQRFDPNGY